jgi:hypothetical protein
METYWTSGEETSTYTIDLAAGDELRIVYEKDGSVDNGKDTLTVSNLIVVKQTIRFY